MQLDRSSLVFPSLRTSHLFAALAAWCALAATPPLHASGGSGGSNLTSLAPYTLLADDFDEPVGVAVGSGGAVYVSDEDKGRVYEIAPSGTKRVVVSGLRRPRGIALDGPAHLLVVVDRVQGSHEGAVLRVTLSNGAVSEVFDDVDDPWGVARGSDGSLYVTAKKIRSGGCHHSHGHHSHDVDEGVLVRVPAGGGAPVTVADGFDKPAGVALLADGTVAVAAEEYERHGEPDLQGSLFRVSGDGTVSVLVETSLKEVGGVALDATGAHFLGGRRGNSANGGAVLKRRLDGGVNDLASGLREPSGVAFAPDGDLIVADAKTGKVWRFEAPAAPTVNATSPAYTNQNPYALSGTATAGAAIQVTLNGNEQGATAGGDGAWSVSLTLLENTENALTVASVGAGGQGLASTPRTLQAIHDNIAPTIAAVPAPAPNAAGWNNTDVSVTFACSDGGSGIASCSGPVTLTEEGAGQATGGTAVDRAGNTAQAALSVSIDKTPPSINAVSSPLPNAAGWIRSDAALAFFCLDLLSDIAVCPPEIAVTAEGANQVFTGVAQDAAGNSASTSVTISLDKTPPTVIASASSSPNSNGWYNADVTVAFEAVDALSGVEAFSEPVTLTGEGQGLTATGTARDRAGNEAQPAVFSADIDRTAPEIAITAPEPGTVRRVPSVTVSGTAADANGLFEVSVEGVGAGAESPWSAEVELTQEGTRTLVARAEDVAGNVTTASVDVVLGIAPQVTITSPGNLDAVGTTPITVTGTVDDPDAVITVGIEAVPAVVTGNTFTATGVPLREGGNVVTASAADTLGNASSASVTVVLDTTAPRVLIDSPRAGSVTTDESVTVTGRINDLVLGTVNSGQAQVSVNGIAAEVANRTFIARDVPLSAGSNAITATATDAVGNSDAQTVTVLRDDVAGTRLRVLSGDGQVAPIAAELAEPLVVALADGSGAPLAGRSVVFRVASNNGTLRGASGDPSRGLVVTTDADGLASARLTLGTRAGVGNNRVEVTSPGVIGAAIFTASGTAQPADKVSLDSGSGQIGAVGQPLPRPFVAVVTDGGHNRLGGVPVTFRVLEGEGNIAGETETTVMSDGDGRALVVLTLGPRPGIANNVVSASVAGHEEEAAGFVASAREPGDPLETSISGVVLDNSNVPLQGVTLRVRGTAHMALSDAQGQFRIPLVPVGNVHLQVDGTTTQRPGTWPSLEFEIVTVPGIDNTLGMPIYLVQLDTANGIFVDETHGGTLTLPEYPGFSLTVQPNSATFPDGTRRGTISVTAVHVDKVPMVPNFGQQPRFIVTIQPPGVHFDPPAAVAHPNVDGMKPGEVTEIYSFDHDMGSFVATGTATVSEDGTTLRSDPGMGIVKGGWHCGGNPAGSGTTHNCPMCKKCVTPNCVADDGQTPPQKAPDDCKKEVCRGGSVKSDPNDGETPKQKAPDDCKKEVCRSGAPKSENDDSETPKAVEGNCKKEVCKDGKTKEETDDSDTPQDPKKKCCDGKTYDTDNQCCENKEILAKNPIADLDKCPNRVKTKIQQPWAGGNYQFDGCSNVPDNPAGGADTHFSMPNCIPTQSVAACTGACDVHDICYQTCWGTNMDGGRLICDQRLLNTALATCARSTAPPDTVQSCNNWAQRYYDGLRWLGGSAFKDRQKNVCDCCG